jgi:hypothetical protein
MSHDKLQIDPQDMDLLAMYTWGINQGYLRTHTLSTGRKNKRSVYLHQLIAARMGITGRPDHINRDRLDNRRSNIREVTLSQSIYNRGGNRNNTTGFRGVSFHNGHYRATIMKDRKQIFCGYFNTPREAAVARDKKAKLLHGEFASLNEDLI